MQLKDVTPIIKAILHERDKIPLTMFNDQYVNSMRGGIRKALREIEQAPTIDAVPVVRCKDCKYMRERHYEKPGEEPYIKRACESKYGLTERYMVNEWDYCSRGERRI